MKCIFCIFQFLPFVLLLFGVLEGCASKENVSVTPAEHLEKAWEYFSLAEFDLASEQFSRAQEIAESGSADRWQSLMGLGACWNTRREQRDSEKALRFYKEAAENAPDESSKAWTALDTLRVKHVNVSIADGSLVALSPDYRSLYLAYPKTRAGQEALLQALQLEATVCSREKAGELLKELDLFIQANPEGGMLDYAYGMKAGLYDRRGEFKPKLQSLLNSLKYRELDPLNPNPQLATTFYGIAVVAEFEAGDFITARQFYRKLIETYPQDMLIFRCEQALLRLDEVESLLRQNQPVPSKYLGQSNIP